MNLLIIVAVLALAAFYLGRRRSLQSAGGDTALMHSLPSHYGGFVALMAAGPALALILLWSVISPLVLRWATLERIEGTGEISSARLDFLMADVRRLAEGEPARGEVTPGVEQAAAFYATLDTLSTVAVWLLALVLALGLAYIALQRVASPKFRARNHVERVVAYALLAAAAISILTTAGIVFSVLFESVRFFQRVPVTEFLFGTQWSPQTALRADQVGSSGSFGAVPLFAGTLLISVIAMLVAAPIGLLAAMYLAEYASPKFRGVVKPILEILAGVPTVVYGFFAALTVAPFIRDVGEAVGLDVSSQSALAAGLVMGIMIIPFVSSLSDDAITAVPQAMRDASLGLGATRAETITQVIVPAALPGIIAGLLLAVSRAIGETMIVVMAAGLAANLTANPLDAVTTVTVQIVTLLVGDQEFDSAKTLSAFALGLVLFVATLLLNVVALYVMQKYREKYD